MFSDPKKNEKLLEEIFDLVSPSSIAARNIEGDLMKIRSFFLKYYPTVRIHFNEDEKKVNRCTHLIQSNDFTTFKEEFLNENSDNFKWMFEIVEKREGQTYFWIHEVFRIGTNRFQHQIVDHLGEKQLLKKFLYVKDSEGLTPLHRMFLNSQHPSIISKSYYLLSRGGGDKTLGITVFRELPIETSFLQEVMVRSIKRNNVYCWNICFQIFQVQFYEKTKEYHLSDLLEWFLLLRQTLMCGNIKSLQFYLRKIRKLHDKKLINIFDLFKSYHDQFISTNVSPHSKSKNSIGLLESILKNEKISWKDEKFKFCSLLLSHLQPLNRNTNTFNIISQVFKSVNYENFSALHYAIAHNNLELTSLFIQYGADLEKVCWRKKTKMSNSRLNKEDSFISQRKTRRSEIVERDVDSSTENDDEEEEEEDIEIIPFNSLMLGIHLNCNIEIVDLLIKKGVSISETSNSVGNHPLILASENNRPDIIKLLIQNHVCLDLGNEGSIFHHLSENRSRYDILILILNMIDLSLSSTNPIYSKERLSSLSNKKNGRGQKCWEVFQQTNEQSNDQVGQKDEKSVQRESLIMEKMKKIFDIEEKSQITKVINRDIQKNTSTNLDNKSTNIRTFDTFYAQEFEYKESFLWKIKKEDFGGCVDHTGKSVIKSPNFETYFYSFFLRLFFFDDGNRFCLKVGVKKHEPYYALRLDYQIFYRMKQEKDQKSRKKMNKKKMKMKSVEMKLLSEARDVDVTNQDIPNINFMGQEVAEVSEFQTHEEDEERKVDSTKEEEDGERDDDSLNKSSLHHDRNNIVNCSTDSLVFLRREEEELMKSEHFVTDPILEGCDTSYVLLKISFLKLKVLYKK